MAIRKVSFRASSEGRLDQVLAVVLPTMLGRSISKAKVRKLIVAGAVYLNKKRLRIASKPLRQGALVDIYIDEQKLWSVEDNHIFEFTEDRVLFEDDYLIIVDKPPRLPTQPTLDEARINIYSALKSFLVKRYGHPSPYLGLHHRLDRDTSGVILFTKREEVNRDIGEMFASRGMSKTYLAITQKPDSRSPIEKSWITKNFLGSDANGRGKTTKQMSVNAGGDLAVTEFRLLETFIKALLVEAKPKTGRTHQIRVHLSESRMAILGDHLYGGAKTGTDILAARLMLHAQKLEFTHPVTGSVMKIESPIPNDFQTCLDELRKK